MRAPTNRDTLVGVFRELDEAEAAVEELRSAGFREDQIGFAFAEDGVPRRTPADVEGVPGGIKAYDADVVHGDRVDDDDHDDDDHVDTGPGAGGGALTGAVTGGLVAAAATAFVIPGIGPILAGGLLAATLTGVAVGAATGGLLGALIDLGVPEDEARAYDEEFRSGNIVVTVRTEGRYDEAASILFDHGAYDVDALGRTMPVETAQATGMGGREARFTEHDGDVAIHARDEAERTEIEGSPEEGNRKLIGDRAMPTETAPDPTIDDRPVSSDRPADDVQRRRIA
jgi:hypothetical protein